jgi:FkbM family methyltransferase
MGLRMTTPALLSFDDFERFLNSAESRFVGGRLGRIKELVATGRVNVFGYGGKGRALAKQIAVGSDTVVSVYDSSPKTRALAAVEGFVTVDTLDELRQSKDGVILGACQDQLGQAAIVPNNHIFYQEAAYVFDTPHLENRAREVSNWIVGNNESLYELYTAVHPQSREVLLAVLSFRLSLDPRDLQSSRKPNADMWFDVPEIHGRRDYKAFLDVGAYDGDTLRGAHHRLSVTRGIAVEANASLFDAIRVVAESYSDGIRILPHAAWSHKCRLHFSEIRGGMISVSEADDGELDAGPIDEWVTEPIDLLKMDIEGAEIAALRGCKRTLETCPDLAIAAYHRPQDLVELATFIRRAGYERRGYVIHIGHYSDCFDDTILYFLQN